MPRDYKKEYREYHSKPEQKENRAQRNAARREMEREGKVRKGDGKDVHHKKPLSSGGSNSRSNLEVTSTKENRGWRKGKSGYNP
jgi:5-methylcytosine-specific restriction endonuclease McrA